MVTKSWAWISAYEKARKRYGVAKSKQIANMSCKKTKKAIKPKRKKTVSYFGL